MIRETSFHYNLPPSQPMKNITVHSNYLCNNDSSEGEDATQQHRCVAEAVHLALFRGLGRQRL